MAIYLKGEGGRRRGRKEGRKGGRERKGYITEGRRCGKQEWIKGYNTKIHEVFSVLFLAGVSSDVKRYVNSPGNGKRKKKIINSQDTSSYPACSQSCP